MATADFQDSSKSSVPPHGGNNPVVVHIRSSDPAIASGEYSGKIPRLGRKAEGVAFVGSYLYNPADRPRIEEQLKLRIEHYCKAGIKRFICGFSDGFERTAVQLIAGARERNPDISLVTVAAHGGQLRSGRSKAEDLRLQELWDRADVQVLISRSHFPGCHDLRNEFMIRNASALVGYYDGRRSTHVVCRMFEQAHGRRMKVANLHKDLSIRQRKPATHGRRRAR